MPPPFCQGFIAFLLKFLNFLQTFIGISIIIYSAYMLNHWNHHYHDVHDAQFPNFGSIVVSNSVVSALQELNKNSLPAPWFIYAFMGIGVILCCITCIGHVGAEAVNGCCLCFYSLLMTIVVLLEVSLAAYIAIDHHWEKAFSLFLAIVLRTLVSSPRLNHDIERDYDVVGRTREPLLDPRISQTSGLAKGDARGDFDIWSSQMREKVLSCYAELNFICVASPRLLCGDKAVYVDSADPLFTTGQFIFMFVVDLCNPVSFGCRS